MKLIIDISYEELMMYAIACNDGIGNTAMERILNGTPLGGVLQEIRQEILDKYITATGEVGTVANGCLKIIDKHIKEIEG